MSPAQLRALRTIAAVWLEAKLGRKGLLDVERAAEAKTSARMAAAGVKSIEITRANGEKFAIARVAGETEILDVAGLADALPAKVRAKVFPTTTITEPRFDRAVFEQLVAAGTISADVVDAHTTRTPTKVYLRETLKRAA